MITQIKQIAQHDAHLLTLLQQVQYYQYLDQKIKLLMPSNIKPHFRVVCLRDNMLILHTSHHAAASRLKMLLPALLTELQNIDQRIHRCHIKMQPESPKPIKAKDFAIPPSAIDAFHQTAHRVRHHPELSSAIYKLIEHHQQSNDPIESTTINKQ